MLVCQFPIDREDGPTLHMLALQRELRGLGVDVQLISPPIGPASALGKRVSLLRLVHTAVQGRAEPPLIYLRGCNLLIAFYCRVKGIPLGIEFNGNLLAELRLSGTSRLTRCIAWLEEFVTSAICRFAVVVDPQLIPELTARYPQLHGKSHLVPNGSNTALFADAYEKLSERSPPQTQGSIAPLRLIFVGGLHRWTCIEAAVHALKLLPDRVTIDIVGDGEKLDSLQAQVATLKLESRVVFCGRLSQQDAADAMAMADIGLAPTLPEIHAGSPLKVSEYLAAGLAVVVNDRPGTRYIEELGFGRCIADVTPETIAAAVMDISENDAQDPARRQQRIDYASKHLGWRNTAKKLLSVSAHRVSGIAVDSQAS